MPPTAPKTRLPIPLRDFSENEKRMLRSLIDSSAGPDACWPMSGAANAEGYGYICLGGVQYRAHRVALHIVVPCPNGSLMALHSCDSPGCCNPSHLRWGTAADNASDCTLRGRHKSRAAERHHGAKLNWEKVKLIREVYVPNKIGCNEIAKKLGVSHATVSRIANHLIWKIK
jgi:hypothetical protein